MNRLAVLILLLALFAITAPVIADIAPPFSVDFGAKDQAAFTLKSETPGNISFSWTSQGIESFDPDAVSNFSLEGANNALSSQGLVRLPWGREANLVISGGMVSHYSDDGSLIETLPVHDVPFEFDWAVLENAAVFRDLTVAPLSVNPVIEQDDGSYWVATHLELDVEVAGQIDGVGTQPPNWQISRAFYPLYKSLLLNGLDELGANLAHSKGTFLIVSANGYMPRMESFIEWKKQKGHNIVLHTYDSAPTFNELRVAIANYYETLDPPLEYVLLVGDENRGASAAIPANRIVNPAYPSENDVTDWSYVFIEGQDYFPEVFIGRFTAGTLNEVGRIASGVVNYEKTPFAANDDDMYEQITVVAGNYSDTGDPPLTPVSTSWNLAHWMKELWGVSLVDTLFWRDQNGPGASDVFESIERGTMFVTYRGWGNVNGWAAPAFESTDVDNLQNVDMLPIVTSFVCNTGDFGNLTDSKCFAEHWITAGTQNSPKGAVTVVAPSDLHTQTKYNNPLIMGFYFGIYQHSLYNVSSALLHAKSELYKGHVNLRGEGNLVEFYYHVYHVLGDPTLDMWPREPRQLDVTMANSVALGSNHLEVNVSNDGEPNVHAYVQAIQGDNLFEGGFVDSEGSFSIPLLDAEAGEVQVTVTCQQFAAVIETVTITQQNQYVAAVDWDVSGADDSINPGETVELTVTLKNTGTANQTGVQATLSHPDENLVTINTATADFGAINADQEATNATPFSFTVGSELADQVELEFNLEVSGSAGGPWIEKVWIPVQAVNLVYQSAEVASGQYQPGGTANINVTFQNLGSIDAENVTAQLVSWDNAVTVQTDEASLGTVSAGGTATTQSPFVVTVAGGTYGSRVISYGVNFLSGGEVIDHANFRMALEGVQTTDPLGPDEYGYFAYDNTDTAYDQAPTYSWPNLENDANAEYFDLRDDDNEETSLPFDFRLYGHNYTAGSTLTISSNGWIMFGDDEPFMRYLFRNWHLPSPFGWRAMVFGFWDDLKSIPGERIDVYTRHTDGKFIIEWENAVTKFGYDSQDYQHAEFAIILFDPEEYPTADGNGIIEFHYRAAENNDTDNNGCTVGIENHNHKLGFEYTYGINYPAAAAPLEAGRAIRLTTTAPDNMNAIDEKGKSDAVPSEFNLYAGYPNPFNSTTEIRFDLPVTTNVRLSVYNIMGQEVARLVNRDMNAGAKTVSWDVSNTGLSSGLYFVRMDTPEFSAMNKVMYLK